MTEIKSLHRLELPLPPSCVAVSPQWPDLFVVGTYNLEKTEQDSSNNDEETSVAPKPQSRNGSLILFGVDGDNVQELQTQSTKSAILDIAFSPHNPWLLCTATSTGSLLIHNLANSLPSLSPVSELQIFDSSTLILDLEFHPHDPAILGVTISTGSVHLLRLHQAETEEYVLVANQEIHNHDLEPWTLAFDPPGNGIYSGGDDCLLRYTSFEPNDLHKTEDGEPEGKHSAPQVQYSDRRAHSAGVTAILPLSYPYAQPSSEPFQSGTIQPAPAPASQPEIQNERTSSLLLTGSDDDTIRLLQIKRISTTRTTVKVIQELNLGGGVWRLHRLSVDTITDSNGERRFRVVVLASCMHAGARVVEITGPADWASEKQSQDEGWEEKWEINVMAKFEEHKSMNYGSDVQPLPLGNGVEGTGESGRRTRTVISTSFYDRLLCLWRWEDSGTQRNQS